MNVKRCKIDSVNLSDTVIESVLLYNKNYKLEDIKTKTTFKPKEWSRTFGKAITRNIIEAKIIHTHLGLKIPLKRYSVSKRYQTIEFAGLNGYNERSRLLLQTLNELKDKLQYARVARLDISIDFKGNIPNSVIKALFKHREPFKYGNTIYLKTQKEKKTNRVMDIKIYNKQHQAKLDFKVMRLEFCFKSEYLKKVQFKDIETIYKKMEKTIKRVANLNVKIDPL